MLYESLDSLVFSLITYFRQNMLSIQDLTALNPLYSFSSRLLYFFSIKPFRIVLYNELILYSTPKFLSSYLDPFGSFFVYCGDICHFPLIWYKMFKHWLFNIQYSFSTFQELSASSGSFCHFGEILSLFSHPLFQCWLHFFLYEYVFAHLLCILIFPPLIISCSFNFYPFFTWYCRDWHFLLFLYCCVLYEFQCLCTSSSFDRYSFLCISCLISHFSQHLRFFWLRFSSWCNFVHFLPIWSSAISDMKSFFLLSIGKFRHKTTIACCSSFSLGIPVLPLLNLISYMGIYLYNKRYPQVKLYSV
jgi:hypothetical protein